MLSFRLNPTCLLGGSFPKHLKAAGAGPAAESLLLPEPAVVLHHCILGHRHYMWDQCGKVTWIKTIKESEFVLIPVRFPVCFTAQVLGHRQTALMVN